MHTNHNAKSLARNEGVALILVFMVAASLIVISAISLDLALVQAKNEKTHMMTLRATQIAESGAAQAIALVKEGGLLTPKSGGDPVTAKWIDFSGGAFYYDSTMDVKTGLSVIRSFGRVRVKSGAVAMSVDPENSEWRNSGWLIRGIEITLLSSVYIPTSPMYFGNGGVEQPLGGFNWSGGSDPLADPSTWSLVTSSPSSYQENSVPFEVSALDHPADYLTTGTAPLPASTFPHPYQIWSSQNPIGQFNINAWFKNSAGAGYDPETGVTPPPTSSYFESSDSTSPDYPYAVDSRVPDVQTYSWALWSKYKNNSDAKKLSAGSHSGEYGTLANPQMTFVTGALTVDSGETFKGTGILVIRDEFDPNVDSDNTPSNRAGLFVKGNFEWTGLVIVAGWAPTIEVSDEGDASIVGSLFGEDSVQSGSEISLDSATIVLRVKDHFRILYSSELFQPGGFVHSLMPMISKEVVGIRSL